MNSRSLVVIDGRERPDQDHRFVRPGVMAAYLGIDRSTLYRWTAAGELPAGSYEAHGKRRPEFRYQPSSVCRVKQARTQADPNDYGPAVWAWSDTVTPLPIVITRSHE